MERIGNKAVVLGVAFLACLLVAMNFSVSEGGSPVEKILERLKRTYKPPQPLLPVDVEMKAGFKPGKGLSVGKVQMVQGEAVVVHKGQKVAYRLKRDFPVFMGDVLITGERSRVSVRLADRSAFALAPVSKIEINKSVYDPAKKKRSSLLSLWFGRARFLVAKIMGEKRTDYRVRTPTAVCGVRGSDFALAVTPEAEKSSSLHRFFSGLGSVGVAYAQAPVGTLLTTVIAGPNTTLTFQGLTGPIQVVVSNSVCVASVAEGATAVTALTESIVQSVLNGIAAQMASVSMPPGLE